MSWLVHGVWFACEIAAIVAFVWWGWPILGIVAGAVVIAAWGAFVAPKSTRRLADPARGVLELVIFAAATAGFASVGQTFLAIVFGVAAAVSAGLSRRFAAP
jgi:Protein of unknown function (DUF2568)